MILDFDNILYEEDIQNDFDSPFLYSMGIEQKFNNNYTLSFNTSKNFRIPTFNDLYWQPGGNINLKPENSYQFEFDLLAFLLVLGACLCPPQ